MNRIVAPATEQRIETVGYPAEATPEFPVHDVHDPELRAKANRISTDFKIKREAVDVIERCVADLVRPDTPALQQILRVLGVRSAPAAATEAATLPAAPVGNSQGSTDLP